MNYTPFNGDGRKKAHPLITPNFPLEKGLRPAAVTYANARLLVDMFLKSKGSSHSAMGSTLWVICAWCHHNNHPHHVDVQRIDGEVAGFWVSNDAG